MPISMSTSAHYVTQSSVFDHFFLGPLTDRKIRAYQKRGHYDNDGFLKRSKEKTRRKGKKKTTQAELRKLYVF